MSNRKERRRAGNKEKVPTYNLTMPAMKQIIDAEVKKQVETIRNEAAVKAIDFTLSQTVGVFMVSVHDEFGFGKERLDRLIKRFNGNFDSVNAGNVELADIFAWCKEYGLDLTAREDGVLDGKN